MASAPQSPSPSRSSFALTAAVVLACFLIFAGVLVVAYLPVWKGKAVGASFTQDEVKQMVKDKKLEESDAWKYSVEGRAARLTELRGKELTAATTYGWVDQSAGIVRLPVERAMELVVQEQGAKN